MPAVPAQGSPTPAATAGSTRTIAIARLKVKNSQIERCTITASLPARYREPAGRVERKRRSRHPWENRGRMDGILIPDNHALLLLARELIAATVNGTAGLQLLRRRLAPGIGNFTIIGTVVGPAEEIEQRTRVLRGCFIFRIAARLLIVRRRRHYAAAVLNCVWRDLARRGIPRRISLDRPHAHTIRRSIIRGLCAAVVGIAAAGSVFRIRSGRGCWRVRPLICLHTRALGRLRIARRKRIRPGFCRRSVCCPTACWPCLL